MFKKILLSIIIVITTIRFNIINVSARTYNFSKDGNYDPNGYNILSITQDILSIIGSVLIIGGLLKFIIGKTNNEEQHATAGIILTIIGLIMVSATFILVQLGFLT